MSKKVIIVGAGKHGRVVADIVKASGDNLFGFLDDVNPSGEVLGVPVYGGHDEFYKYNDCYFIIAVGNSKARETISKEMDGCKWYTAIHPSAVISSQETSIGEGTAIMANAVVNPGSSIGKHCIINTGSIVDHDNSIGDFVHVSVGAMLAGSVNVGKHSWIGVGTAIIDNVSICEECMIGGGATIIDNITESGTYVGVPVRKIK